MKPETEIKYFKFLPYPDLNLIFLGDFNCPQSHSVFIPLKKMGYVSVFTNQKTSLKKDRNGEDSLASEFDNLWYNSAKCRLVSFNVILFYKQFSDLERTEKISDHIPIGAEISLK